MKRVTPGHFTGQLISSFISAFIISEEKGEIEVKLNLSVYKYQS